MFKKNRYFTFITFTILIIIWWLFSASIKFFYNWLYSGVFRIDLQYIWWFLSLGSFIAYIIWWILSYVFTKRSIIFFISIFLLCILIISYISWIHNLTFLWLVVTFYGFFYWLWTVVKNILIAVEIEKTWMSDTSANAVFTIALIFSTLFGSVLWWYVNDKFAYHGYIFFIILLSISALLSLLLNYEKLDLGALFKPWIRDWHYDKRHKFRQALKDFVPSFKFILKNYTLIIVCTAFIWSISTVISLEAIEFAIRFFHKTQTQASFLLFYWAIWVIIGNIITINWHKKRWFYFNILNILFAITIFIFPFFVVNYKILKILVVFSWIFFWWTSNLIDAYLLHRIWQENKKEHGSAVFGFTLSWIMFIMMFLSNFIEKNKILNNFWNTLWVEHLWFYVLCIFLSFLTIAISLVIYTASRKKIL